MTDHHYEMHNRIMSEAGFNIYRQASEAPKTGKIKRRDYGKSKASTAQNTASAKKDSGKSEASTAQKLEILLTFQKELSEAKNKQRYLISVCTELLDDKKEEGTYLSFIKSDIKAEDKTKFLVYLNRELRRNSLSKSASRIETRFYESEELGEAVVLELYNEWKGNITGKHGGAFPIEKEYDERMNRAKQMGQATRSLEYLWAAKYAAGHRKNFSEFKRALELAAQARTKSSTYAHQGPELEVLAKKAERVFAEIQRAA